MTATTHVSACPDLRSGQPGRFAQAIPLRTPGRRVGDEHLRESDEHAWIIIAHDRGRRRCSLSMKAHILRLPALAPARRRCTRIAATAPAVIGRGCGPWRFGGEAVPWRYCD